jgi:hypothetical protein
MTGATLSTLTGTAAGNYLGSATVIGTPQLTVTAKPLTATIADQAKVYGAGDPALAGISVPLTGLVNRTVASWNGDVSVNDSAVNAALSALVRTSGESAGSYTISGATFAPLGGAATANYSSPTFTGTPTLTIGKASLTAAIVNQSKIYGADDPALAGITPTLSGVMSGVVVANWMGASTTLNDSPTVTVSSLTRGAGENVGSYTITAAAFGSLGGTGAGNYNAPSLSGVPVLTITARSLTATLGNQTKVYGTNDVLLAGMTPTLGGALNGATVTNWMGGTLAINDSPTASLVGLTRAAGENAGSYAITAASFGPLSGIGAANYAAPTSFTGTPTLTITVKALSATLANQTKVYGTDDAALGSLTPIIAGAVSGVTVTDWMGANTLISDSPTATLASLTRAIGENVGSYTITGASFNAMTGTGAANYIAPVLSGSPTLTIGKADLTATIANQTKVYGQDDPTLAGIAPVLGGTINRTVVSWNGNVALNDTGNVGTTLASLTRASGENVGSHAIIGASFTALSGSAAGNYNAPTFTGTPTLTVSAAPLTASIAGQSKIYGTDDPALAGMAVNLTGAVNRTVTTWGGNVAIDDSAAAALATTLASLTRTAGENAGSYTISAASFNAYTGTSAANYSAPSFTGVPTLTIGKASVTASIANQTKVYGADDMAPGGIAVALTPVNRTVSTWAGPVTVNDSGTLSVTLASLTRDIGENVSSYTITAASFGALAGSSAGNYNAPVLIGSPTLLITAAPLTASLSSQSKVYGADDPLLGGITPSLGGLINRMIASWNGNVLVNDSGNVGAALTGLTRTAGENVGSHAITAASLGVLTGSAAGNYSTPSFTGSPTLSITPASLTGSIASQSKVYGMSDPALASISVTLAGLANRTLASWNGAVSVNDSTAVSAALSALVRSSGENAGSYAISGATFAPLAGASAGNYNAPTFTGTPALTISTAPLSATIAGQTKVYGADDPALLGITPTLTGAMNGVMVANWMGASTTLTDAPSTTLAGLARQAGENVSSYAITGAVFGALSGAGAANYSAPVFSGAPVLTVTPAPITVLSVSRTYDGSTAVAGTTAGLSGVLNRSVSTWTGSVSVNDSVSLTFSGGSYADRNAGSGKAVTLNAVGLSGSGAGNYLVAGLSGGNYAGSVGLINQAPLTVVAQTNTKAFDGTTAAAAVPIVSGLQGTDTAVASETYDTAAAGTGKTLTPVATINDGNGSANYLVSFVANASGEITGTTPTPTPTPTPSSTGSSGVASDSTVPLFVPTVANELMTRAAGAIAPALSPVSLLTVSSQVTATATPADLRRALAVPAPDGRLRALAAGAAFVNAYSDGSAGATTMIAIDQQAIRFTVADRTLSLRMNVPVAVGSEMLARFAFDVSGGSATVSAVRSVGTLGGGSLLAQDARQIGVRMSSDKGETPLEFTVGFSQGVVSITPKGATAQAIFGQQRDEARFRLVVGQALLDAATRLKAVNITAVRLIRPVL